MTDGAPTSAFTHRHLLGITPLSAGDIQQIIDLTLAYKKGRKAPARLAGKAVALLFFEPSTRTLLSFELAAKRLGMDVLSVGMEQSSLKKNESLEDMVQTIAAMGVHAMVVRHKEHGVPDSVAAFAGTAAVINAGEGMIEHPTQALLDAAVITEKKGKIKELNIAICGDIAHSRVAMSNIALLTKMGAHVRLMGPENLVPQEYENIHENISVFHDLEQGIKDCDVVMMLRIQFERMDKKPDLTLEKYFEKFGLTHQKLKAAKKDVIVMHPGPMNRGVEIDRILADDPNYSVILDQVEMGVYTRMACLDLLLS